MENRTEITARAICGHKVISLGPFINEKFSKSDFESSTSVWLFHSNVGALQPQHGTVRTANFDSWHTLARPVYEQHVISSHLAGHLAVNFVE